MLVLSRKPGESIIIGDITITVVSIDRGKVKLGITAPQQVTILREELIRFASDTCTIMTPDGPEQVDLGGEA